MNKIEELKQAKNGLDVLADIRAHAANDTPVGDIPADDLIRMKW